MIPLPSKDMDVNKFVDVKLPTKRQIFARVGGYASDGLYSRDDVVRPGMKPTEQADSLVRAAENYKEPEQNESTKEDLPE